MTAQPAPNPDEAMRSAYAKWVDGRSGNMYQPAGFFAGFNAARALLEARLPNGRTPAEERAWLYEALSKEITAKDEARARLAAFEAVVRAVANHNDDAGIPHWWPVCGKPLVDLARRALAEAEGRAALSSLEPETPQCQYGANGYAPRCPNPAIGYEQHGPLPVHRQYYCADHMEGDFVPLPVPSPASADASLDTKGDE